MLTRLGSCYGGWLRALPGARAHLPFFTAFGPLPPSVDLSLYFTGVYDQGQQGSCTGQGWRGVFEALLAKQGLPYVPLSSRFIYWNERSLEGTTGQDSGAYIHDGSNALAKWGVCPDSLCPYDGDMFQQPSQAAFDAGLKDMLLQFSAVPNNEPSVKAALAAGLPIVFGFTVYESFESAQTASTGIMTMPAAGEQILGGHCTVIKGYDVPGMPDYYYVRNSWGSGWGQRGDFYMPKAYLHDPNLCDELTVAQIVS
jgi:hypothetical protein